MRGFVQSQKRARFYKLLTAKVRQFPGQLSVMHIPTTLNIIISDISNQHLIIQDTVQVRRKLLY